jgi:hypothetical protein
LSTEGGLLWSKPRDDASSHILLDTERYSTPPSTGGWLSSNSTAVESTSGAGSVTTWNTDGFTVKSSGVLNFATQNNVFWTFRKAPKFFDVVEFTYTGSTQISHNLGGKIGAIIMKRTDASQDWLGWYYRGASAGSGYYLSLNTSEGNGGGRVDTEHTDTYFNPAYVRGSNSSGTVTPVSGGTYVAYLFAHNDGDGDFGPNSDQDIIKCGSYTGNGSTTGPEIDLGFEPQWVIVKNTTSAASWNMFDTMRGLATGSGDTLKRLYADTSGVESNSKGLEPTSTGFKLTQAYSGINASSANYIYMAIRRGPLAKPTSATDVFAIDTANASLPTHQSGFVTDTVLRRINKNTTNNFDISSRLTQGRRLFPGLTNQEFSISTYSFDYMNGAYDIAGLDTQDIAYMWKRAPSYFDVVTYTGNGTSGNTISHNLGVEPEMMWVKNRDTAGYDWFVYHKDLDATAPEDKYLRLNTSSAVGDTTAYWNDTAPTASVFSLGNGAAVNTNNENHIAYLFATVAGISKVGSYTGNGTSTGDSQNIDCGFSSGARFVLIKASSAAYSWFLFDTVRGITSGNDSLLILNDTDAETTAFDSVDPYSSGFTAVQGPYNVNQNGVSYIFYAIA